MIEIYFITAQKILVMLIFIAVGFVMRRNGKLPEQGGKALSVLETNLFLPSLIFQNLSANFTSETIKSYLVSFAIGICFLAVIVIIARLLSIPFGKTKENRNLYTYIFAFSNYAYFGYPVIESVFGTEMLANTIIFAVPFTITIFTYGVHLLTGDGEDEKTSVLQRLNILFSPVIIAVVLGIIFGLTSIHIPKVISSTLAMSSSCMSPVAMILTGFVLAAFPFGELFKSKLSYLISFIRLAIIPTLFGIILWFVGLRGENYIIPVIISAMPVGMNVVIFAEAKNKDSKNSARICFISYVLSLLTIPAVFSVLSYVN